MRAHRILCPITSRIRRGARCTTPRPCVTRRRGAARALRRAGGDAAPVPILMLALRPRGRRHAAAPRPSSRSSRRSAAVAADHDRAGRPAGRRHPGTAPPMMPPNSRLAQRRDSIGVSCAAREPAACCTRRRVRRMAGPLTRNRSRGRRRPRPVRSHARPRWRRSGPQGARPRTRLQRGAAGRRAISGGALRRGAPPRADSAGWRAPRRGTGGDDVRSAVRALSSRRASRPTAWPRDTAAATSCSRRTSSSS